MDFNSDKGESLARYITQRNHIRFSNSTIRHNAFMPPPSGRFSMYRISGLLEDEIWAIGKKFVADVLKKPLQGRGDLNSKLLYEQGLTVQSAPEPHPRHVNVVGWDLASTQTRLIAVKLASLATLRLFH